MKFLEKIKRWPFGKKRIFSIFSAIFLTILIIIFNQSINSIWKNDASSEIVKNNQINSIQESLSQIISQATPILDQAFGSSTEDMATQTANSIDQINSTTSSSTATSSVVE